MERKISIFIQIFFSFLLLIMVDSGEAYSLKVGEKLTYRVTLGGFHVGKGLLQIKQITQIKGEPVYHFISRTKSSEFISLFYPLDDKMESFADIETLYPHQLIIHYREGYLRKNKIVVDINLKKGTALTEEKEGEKRKWKKEFSLPLFDTVSLIYWLRLQNLEVGEVFSLSLIEGSKVRKIKVKVIKEEEISISNKRYPALLCSEIDSNNKAKKTGIWFSTTNEHIPLKLQIKISLGTLTLYLINKD
ncbi:MAG: DUF3108 domain-containing protein [Candidatus Aerophobetes bacterium]|nr:DUF3108 domain-containing protein [Candidatus Aerophobetes bacterium]